MDKGSAPHGVSGAIIIVMEASYVSLTVVAVQELDVQRIICPPR